MSDTNRASEDGSFAIAFASGDFIPVTGYRAFFKLVQSAEFRQQHAGERASFNRQTKSGHKPIMTFTVEEE